MSVRPASIRSLSENSSQSLTRQRPDVWAGNDHGADATVKGDATLHLSLRGIRLLHILETGCGRRRIGGRRKLPWEKWQIKGSKSSAAYTEPTSYLLKMSHSPAPAWSEDPIRSQRCMCQTWPGFLGHKRGKAPFPGVSVLLFKNKTKRSFCVRLLGGV